MRNIQNKLKLFWNKDNKIYELISELPIFCNNFEYQIKEGILPNIGIYYLNSYKYDINDFLANNNNICFKFKAVYANEDDLTLKVKYLLITASAIIILEPVDVKFKNICMINYIGELFAVQKLEKFESNQEIFEEYYCFKIIWNKNISFGYNNVICIEKDDKIKNDITNIILARKDIINNNFQLIEKNENLEVEDYKFIIDIKKKLIQKEPNEIIYDEINSCYRKIIEILSNIEDDNIQNYVDELHNFIEDFEKKYLKK